MRNRFWCEPIKPIAVAQATLAAHLFQPHKMSFGQARVCQRDAVTLEEMGHLSEFVNACQMHMIDEVKLAMYGDLAVIYQHSVDIDVDQRVSSFGLNSTEQLGTLQYRMVPMPAHHVSVYEQADSIRRSHVVSFGGRMALSVQRHSIPRAPDGLLPHLGHQKRAASKSYHACLPEMSGLAHLLM